MLPGSIAGNNYLQSANFATGVDGWCIWGNGDVEFNNGYFRGDISAATGTFGGSIEIGTSPNWFKVDADGNAWSGRATLAEAKAGTFAATKEGVLYAKSAVIGNWNVNSTSIYTGTEDHSGYTTNAGDITIYSNGTDASIHAKQFYIDTSGILYATGVTVSGTITATGGAIGGWTINSTSIYTGTEDHSGYTTNAGDLTIYSDGTDASIHAKNFYIDTNGNLTATSVTISGAITATSGAIGGWSINSTSIYTGTEDHSGYTANAGDMTIYSDGSDSSIHAKNFYIDTTGALYCTSATVSGAVTTTAGSSVDGQYLVANSVASASANLAMRGWTFSGTFSSTDADTVTWTAGTFTASDATAYSILTGNTGNMAALTYIYLDIAVSTTALQVTTTAATSVGNGKVLIAVAQNQTSRATFQVFGGSGGETLLVDHLVANSASTNEFVSNTAQIANLVVTSAKINDLEANKITAGTGIINALSVLNTLTMGSAATNGTIQSYGWDGTANGFQILGGATPSITLIGGTITGGTIQTAASGQRTVLTSAGLIGYDAGSNAILYLNNSSDNRANIVSIVSATSGSFEAYLADVNKNQLCLSTFQRPLNTNISNQNARFYSYARNTNGTSYTDTANVVEIDRVDMSMVATVSKTGAGTSTMTAYGNYTSSSNLNYKIEIDGAGPPNTFKWSDDGGSTWDATTVTVTGLAQLLNNGIYILFDDTSNGQVGDYWTFATGAITSSTGHILSLSNTVTYNSGNIIDITNTGTGYDIDGTSSTWYVTKTGEIGLHNIQGTDVSMDIIGKDDGGYIVITAGDGVTAGMEGGTIDLNCGAGTGTGAGGSVGLWAGAGGATSAAGGDVWLAAGSGTGGDANGGSVYIRLGANYGSGTDGKLYIRNANNLKNGILDFDNIASTDKTISFQNITGTVYVSGGTDVTVADGGTGKSSWTQYLIPYADTTTSLSQIAIGTDGQVLTSGGAGVAPSFEDPPSAAWAAGDLLVQSADTQRTQSPASYAMVKEIQTKRNGTIRVKFDIKSGTSGTTVYGRVYKNGVAFGTEQSTTSDVYVTKSEDLAFAAGDLIQLYIKGATTVASIINNFRLYVAAFDSTTVNTD